MIFLREIKNLCNIITNQNITIIGEVPYYYVVELSSSDIGEENIGYVYKGNLMIEEPKISEEDNKEEAAAEDSVKTRAEAKETEDMGEF